MNFPEIFQTMLHTWTTGGWVMGAMALLATYVPARRASRLDLIESLRRE